MKDDVIRVIQMVTMLIAKDDDLAEVKHFAREWTIDHGTASVLNVYIVNAELVGGPAHCPPRRVVAFYVATYYFFKWIYNRQRNYYKKLLFTN